MEAAIAWLVQTILATLLIDKLDAWIRQVGFAEDVQKLKSEIRRIKIVVSAVKQRGIGNELLAEPLALLKDHLYEADDVIDELDYYRLQHQVQEVTAHDPQGVPAAEQVDDTPRGNADMPLDDTSNCRGVKKRKRRSKAWENFDVIEEDQQGNPVKARCKHCLTPIKCAAKDGTSGMLNHNKVCQKKPEANEQPPNPSSAGDATETATPVAIPDSSGRKRREDDESAQITAASTYAPWDRAELSNRIQNINSQLQNAREELSELLKLHGPVSASSSNHHSNTASDQHLRTSSLLSRTVYGRVAEKTSIKNLILEDKSNGLRVLPIAGIAGVGKTALAQFIYNDPDVEKQFQQKIWVWVSRNFDEVRLTREMLEFVSQERHEGISTFAKLQEILKSQANSKRLLIIFDDVWDDMKDCRWDKLLAPFTSGRGNGSVVLVTSRSLCVAKRLGTLKPVMLGALEHDEFLKLFKSCAFGDGNYEGPSNLSTIGLKIAEKLKGNPLAAVSAGALLRKHLTVDHWSNILQKEDWKSLGLSEGIMPALKLSYDQLPYHLQQCFSSCSIFPNKHKFVAKDLVYTWISQGFVNRTCLTKTFEETGWEYLTDLVNLGFFQQVEQEEFSSDSQIWYSECGIMHDFARIVSRTECATIDDLQCNKMSPFIHHLSIVTDSAYNSTDQYGNIPRNEKFEENLRNAVTSVNKLRTLVLLGHYDSFFLKLFKDILKKAENLRQLQMPASCADFNSPICSLVNPTHLRYVKITSDGLDGDFPVGLIKFFHLQVLDVGSNANHIVPDGMHNLVSLRHLVEEKGVHSKIASIGSMTSLQEIEFKVQLSSSGFEMAQLRSMNELVQLGLSQLDSVKTGEEAYQARVGDKVHLEKLHLSWKGTLSEENTSGTGKEFFPMDGGGPSSGTSMGTTREVLEGPESAYKGQKELAAIEVLEGLKPHKDLKHLRISGYNGTTSPTWLARNISVTSLQTLHLDDCRGWRILPSLESLPFLRKLKLSSMREVTEVLVPSLEELVLIEMPKLVRCSSTSVEGLRSSLRVLQIEKCHALKEFDLFEKDDGIEIGQTSWLPGLRKLVLRHCRNLEVLKPLPPSTICSELLITEVSILPNMKGSCSEELRVGHFNDDDEDDDEYEEDDDLFDEYSDELKVPKNKILAFQNLSSLKLMRIDGCQNLSSFSFKGFSQLISLKRLEIRECKKLDATHEDVTAANYKAFPSLQSLSINLCGIAGKWLSLLLRHAPDLVELNLKRILPMEEEGDSSSGEQDDALTESEDGLVHIPLNLLSSLKKIIIKYCPGLTFNWSEEGFSGFISLQELTICGCTGLLSSFIMLKDGNDEQANGRWLLPRSHGISGCSQETLQPCFPRNLTSLKKLDVRSDLRLESLHLHSCTALEELTIEFCESLTALEGLQSLGSLRHLAVYYCPGLRPWLESLSSQGYELCSPLETLHVDDPSVLTTSLCVGLTSLRRLKLQDLEQGRALVLLKSLQELEFSLCSRLVDLPVRLHLLPSLKRLKLRFCRGISRLPETGLPHSLEELEIESCSKLVALPAGLHTLPSLKRLKLLSCWNLSRIPETGLPPSLEELEINRCSKELTDQCRGLAPSKLRVKIGGEW